MSDSSSSLYPSPPSRAQIPLTVSHQAVSYLLLDFTTKDRTLINTNDSMMHFGAI